MQAGSRKIPRGGLFINLARARDRLDHMRAELKRFGLTDIYRRLNAVDVPADPKAGCFRSHMKAIESAKSFGGILHILEDDSILSASLRPFLFSREIEEALEQYDVLFLDMWVDGERMDSYRQALKRGGLLDLRGLRVGATSSYVVAPGRASRLLKLLKAVDPTTMAIDTALDRLVQESSLSAAVTMPFLTGVSLEVGSTSSIQDIRRFDALNLIALRTSFFAEKERQPFLTFKDEVQVDAPDEAPPAT